jgi:hypothetical protein
MLSVNEVRYIRPVPFLCLDVDHLEGCPRASTRGTRPSDLTVPAVTAPYPGSRPASATTPGLAVGRHFRTSQGD